MSKLGKDYFSLTPPEIDQWSAFARKHRHPLEVSYEEPTLTIKRESGFYVTIFGRCGFDRTIHVLCGECGNSKPLRDPLIKSPPILGTADVRFIPDSQVVIYPKTGEIRLYLKKKEKKEMMESEISCRTCLAFVPRETRCPSGFGHCHRWPPAPSMGGAIWPLVHEKEFCLEHVSEEDLEDE